MEGAMFSVLVITQLVTLVFVIKIFTYQRQMISDLKNELVRFETIIKQRTNAFLDVFKRARSIVYKQEPQPLTEKQNLIVHAAIEGLRLWYKLNGWRV